MPTVGQKEEVATGWEEPSPESIRRRMEIDDGTAAWGDPGKCFIQLFSPHDDVGFLSLRELTQSKTYSCRLILY